MRHDGGEVTGVHVDMEMKGGRGEGRVREERVVMHAFMWSEAAAAMGSVMTSMAGSAPPLQKTSTQPHFVS